jgi:hypothetical protein
MLSAHGDGTIALLDGLFQEQRILCERNLGKTKFGRDVGLPAVYGIRLACNDLFAGNEHQNPTANN